MHPERFGKFRILKKLPGGGMGRVYHAVDTTSQAQIALKLIDHGADQESLDIVDAERRGAILQSRLCGIDSRVTLIHEYGDHEGFFYIAMEYIEGQDLSELLSRQGIGIPFALRIARDICDILDHAHNFRSEIEGHEYHGVVHGDIKPRNIRITSTGDVKLLDFGIAKALSLTRRFTHNQFGSVQYSSPERLNTGEVDALSDLWSVGVVLYEMVAREPYFRAETVPKLEHTIRNYRELKPLPEDWPESLREILARAVSPDPASRYSSAAEMRADLATFPEGGAILPADATRRTTPLRDSSATARSNDTEATRRTSAPSQPVKITTAAAVIKPAPKPVDPRLRLAKTFFGGFVLVFVSWLFLNEWNAWSDSSALAHDIDSERLKDTEEAWKRFSELARRSNMSLTVSGARESLRRKLLADSDRVIEAYKRSDSPTVTEADWIRCQAAAARALELIPSDRSIRGKLRVCEGHIDRIRGTARDNAKLLDSARDKFEQAASLMPKSPDGHLGLARLYVYGYHDVTRAEQALREAGKRGHEPGRRETAQLADAYKDNGDRLFRESEKAFGSPEEREYLKRAAESYDRALELYESIVPFGGAAASLRRVRDSRDVIDRRREEIKQGS